MGTYPKLVYTCGSDGIWILGPGPNPPAEIRNSKGKRLTLPGLCFASIAGHTDLRDWDEVTDEPARPSTAIEQALSEKPIRTTPEAEELTGIARR